MLFVGLSATLISCSSDSPEVFEPPKKVQELGKATLHLTTGDQGKLLNREPELSITELDHRTMPMISLFTDDVKQEIEGFGAALTGSSAYLINQRMNNAQRQELLRDLFSMEYA